MASDKTAGQSSECCLRCGRELRLGSDNCYLVKIEAMADPSPPVISAADLAEDVPGKIDRLLAKMKNLSPQEAMDQVYRRLTFYLCAPCYWRWIENPTG